MKFRVTMKDPDTLHEAIRDAISHELTAMELPDDEVNALQEVRYDKVNAICGKWFGYGEYLEVEIDTEAKTCTVMESKR